MCSIWGDGEIEQILIDLSYMKQVLEGIRGPQSMASLARFGMLMFRLARPILGMVSCA